MSTSRLRSPSNVSSGVWLGWGVAAVELAAVYSFGRLAGWWWLAGLIVVALELRALWTRGGSTAETLAIWWSRLPGVIIGLSATLIVSTVLRNATQVAVVVLYGVWLAWRESQPAKAPGTLAQLLLVQAVMFEAIFLVAAMWQTPSWLILVLVWAGAYLSVYGALKRRGDRSAGVMAATWGVIATEVAWVLLLWLFTFTNKGGYILVPQPALVLTALAYVFGSVLSSSRQGTLSRARLGEYMVIAVILVLIVLVGTYWHVNT